MTHGRTEVVPERSGEIPDAGMSDGQLLGRFNARRDESAEMAFAALVGRHGPMVLRVCRQILGDWSSAEDAFQATFLVLARRSGSIRRPELLGNWLYGVALRTAWEARMRNSRRRQREAPAAEGACGEPAGDACRPEVTLICREEYEALHEEVSRLPERYRVPVVLCELEGLSYQEAATRMHCPVGTVGVRLSRARERLRVRLMRRGIVPAAALAKAMLGAEGASAGVPSVLAESTVRAATMFAAGDAAAAGLVSAPVVVLTEAVLKLMALARLKVATGVALALGLAAAVGVVGVPRRASAPATLGTSQPRPKVEAPPPAKVAAAASAARPPVVPSPAVPKPAVPDAPAAATPIRPAGVATVAVLRGGEMKQAARAVLASLPRPVREERARGERLFVKEWAPDDPLSPGGDGLGPVYNETSCVACHGLGSPGGAGPESKNVVLVTALSGNNGRTPRGLGRIHPGLRATRSTVLHRFGTDPAYASWRRRFYEPQREDSAAPSKGAGEETAEARIQKFAAQTAPDRRLHERTSRLQPAPGITLTVSERNTPALFGAGLIDAIPSEVLVAEAARQPAEIRGRVNRNREGRVGRFGWKAQVASLHEFVRGACAGELGLEVPGHPQAASPLAPDEKAKGLDMSESECDALVAYVRALPAPVVIDPDGPWGTKDMADGRRLFAEVGCTSCHTPSLGEVRGIYSDLLLHDLGPSLSDSGGYYEILGPEVPGGPSPGEWRTPPLWGFRDSGPYLHDGRAQTLEEAVALHGVQGRKSARQFFSLSPQDRSRIEAFLKSLVAPSTATAPGVLLAAELESRVEPDEVRVAEALVRRQREEAAARELREQREARRRQLAEEAVKRARGQFPIAVNLEKTGKYAGAIEFYRVIAREAPDTEEGRSAAERIAALRSRAGSP